MAHRPSIPEIMSIQPEGQDVRATTPEDNRTVVLERRLSLPEIMAIHPEGQDGRATIQEGNRTVVLERRPSLPEITAILAEGVDGGATTPDDNGTVFMEHRQSLPEIMAIHAKGQRGATTPEDNRIIFMKHSPSLPEIMAIHPEGQDGGGDFYRDIEDDRMVFMEQRTTLPEIIAIHPEEQDRGATTSEDNRKVFMEHRPSLPEIMAIQPEEQDDGVIPPAANNPYSVHPEKLEVLETKDVHIVLENKTAYFECKINIELNPTCTWHRNGIQLVNDHRTTIFDSGEWQRLCIEDIQLCDHGMYVLECRHLDRYINVPHRLYVCPQPIKFSVFHINQKYLKAGIKRHLTNTRVFIGDTLRMVAIFVYEADKYFWFKNNKPLDRDSRVNMNRHATRASLTITNARAADTGIYYVLAITSHGYFSSIADVIVGKPNEKRELLPFIEENPPEEVKGYVGEEILICAKVQIDANSMIRWRRNETIIVTNEVKQIDFGNKYIGLLIPDAKISSAGDYDLLMSNSLIPQLVQASLRVTVIEPPPPFPTEVRVVRNLESAVACCGAQVTFDCSFALEDMLYFYVVWHVGHYAIERTNSLFTVICNRGECLLFIKSFEPCMAGDVTCELRRAYPNRASVKVQRSSAHLTCVPPCIIRDRLTANCLPSKLVRSVLLRPPFDFPSEFYENLDLHLYDMVEDGTDDFILKILLCKLDEKGPYFIHTKVHGDDPRRMSCFDFCESNGEDESTLVKWTDSKARPGLCYQLEMLLGDGTYAYMGVTAGTSFYVDDCPIDRMLVFRIIAAKPQLHVKDSVINILPPPEEFRLKVSAIQEVQRGKEFYETYLKTNYNIGAGAFGCVMLVQNKKDHREYAAKIVKASTVQRREHVKREFNIMKNLSHPKIIQLLGFYEKLPNFIFVMEYCWGGELFDRVVAEECLKEADVVRYIYQICEALWYLSNMKIVHLDIKPENIICINPNSTNVKIIDFGVARRLTEDSPRAIYGTREYVAPEVFNYEPISEFSDMWSVGVVTYVLLSGLMPFSGETWYERSIKIDTVQYEYSDDAFEEVSDLAKDFVNQLLIRKPEARMTAKEALNHIWLVKGPPQGAGSKRMTKMRKNLKSYLVEYKHHWQRAGNVMIAAHRLRMLAHPKLLDEKK